MNRTALSAGPATVSRILTHHRRDVRGAVFTAALFTCLIVAMAILATLLYTVISGSLPAWRDRSITTFITSQMSADPQRAGIWQAFYGSLTLMVFTAVIAFPLGISAAIYLEEYAPDTRLTRFINANIRNLAGVPSIVYGLLGLAIFVKLLGGITGPEVEGRSVIAGGLTLGLLTLPIVIITTAESLRAVPNSLREAAYGVGSTQWQVIRHHILPVGAPGIFTGTILSLGRAFGEAAPLLLVGGITTFFSVGNASFLESLQGRFSAMPVLVFSWSRLPQEEFRALTAALIVVMLVVLLLINGTAIYLRSRFEKGI